MILQSCADLSREFKIEKKYLNFPVKYDDSIRHLEFFVDGQKVREMQMALAGKDEADFWVYLELKDFQSQN